MRSNKPKDIEHLIPTVEEFWAAVEEYVPALFDGHPHPLLDGVPYPYSRAPDGTPRTTFLVFRFPDWCHPDALQHGQDAFGDMIAGREQAALTALDQRYITNEKAARRLQEFVYEHLLHGRAYATHDPAEMYDAIEEGTLLLRAIAEDRHTPTAHFSGLARMHAAYMIYWLWYALRTNQVCCVVRRTEPPDPEAYRQELLRMVLSRPTWNPIRARFPANAVDQDEYKAFCAFIGCEGFGRPLSTPTFN